MLQLNAITAAILSSLAHVMHLDEVDLVHDVPLTFSSREQVGAFAADVLERVGTGFAPGYLDGLVPEEVPRPMEGEEPAAPPPPVTVTLGELAQALFDAQAAAGG